MRHLTFFVAAPLLKKPGRRHSENGTVARRILELRLPHREPRRVNGSGMEVDDYLNECAHSGQGRP